MSHRQSWHAQLLTLSLSPSLVPVPTADRVHHRPPGFQDQRDPADVGRPDQDRQPGGWLLRPAGDHHGLPRQHQLGRVPHQRQVRRPCWLVALLLILTQLAPGWPWHFSDRGWGFLLLCLHHLNQDIQIIGYTCVEKRMSMHPSAIPNTQANSLTYEHVLMANMLWFF